MLTIVLGCLVSLAVGGAVSELAFRFFRREKRKFNVTDHWLPITPRFPGREPAPPLNPRWDTTKCRHLNPVPVETGDGPVLVWICTDPDCYAQLELDDPAVISRIKTNAKIEARERADLGFVELVSDLQAEYHDEGVSLPVKTASVLQAERFARRVRQEELKVLKKASKIKVEKGFFL